MKGEHGRAMFWKEQHFEVGSEGVQCEVLLERKGQVIPCKRDEDRKGPETYRRNLGAESISIAEGRGGCVKL